MVDPDEGVRIEDYDPRWPERFETLRLRMAVLLSGMVTAIEHVGSTAVPGLAAKPIIDIDLLLKADRDLPPVVIALTSLGYAHRGDLGITGREAFRPPPNDFPHHLYVCSPDSSAYRQHIAFRDFLRAHREEADAYASMKRGLAFKYGSDREAYTKAKSEFVERILRRAGENPGKG